MSRYVFNCLMTKMIEIFTDLEEFPSDNQDFKCDKIDDYHYLLKARPGDDSTGYQPITFLSSKKYFSISVELSSLSFAQQQIKCKGNTGRLKKLIHFIAIGVGLYFIFIGAKGPSWVRLIFVWGLSFIFILSNANTTKEDIVYSVRKHIIRKTFIKGNRRR